MSYYPHQLDISVEQLVGQWVLTSREEILPRGWPRATHGAWTMAWSAPLECIPIRDASGRSVAWVLGHAVTESGLLLRPGHAPVLAPGEDIGTFADRLNGRFLVVDLRAPHPLLHPDGFASLAGVYSPEESATASTSGLIPRSERTPYQVDHILATDAPYRPAMYPLGLTPRRGVERVLPNHLLDCGSWRLIRRWPQGPIDRSADPAVVVDTVSRQVCRTLDAVAEVLPLDIALTGGKDSRMMLACARRHVGEATIFTADLGDRTSWRDTEIARRITARFALSHRVQVGRARPDELRTWVVRTGGETGEPRGWRGCRALADQKAGRATVTGIVADLGKLVGWRKAALTRPVTPEAMLERCNAQLRPDFIARAETWLRGLPPLDPVAMADVFHIEQVKGCWAGVIEYGELGHSSARFCPMTTRAIIEGAMRLPIDYRLEQRLHLDVMRAVWPELLEFPFNDQLPVPPRRSRYFTVQEMLEVGTEPLRRLIRKARARLAAPRDR